MGCSDALNGPSDFLVLMLNILILLLENLVGGLT